MSYRPSVGLYSQRVPPASAHSEAERRGDDHANDVPEPATEAITALSAGSREQVDETVEKAIDSGRAPWKPAMDEGPMYGGSFQDLDGHVWELVYMEQN